MRILFIADGRSPTAQNWMDYFLVQGHQVHLASTFACVPDERLASFHLTPAAFSGLKQPGVRGMSAKHRRGVWSASMVQARTLVRQWLGPLTLPGAARRLKQVITRVQPELIHAFRIPYEGMMAALAALANPTTPLLVSVWGNDFTLHAPSSPLMSWFTHFTLHRADALHTDCQRDIRLAQAWGWRMDKPAIVLPGGGGIQLDVFYPAAQAPEMGKHEQNLGRVNSEYVINPRGVRAYVRNDTFFRAVPLVLEKKPDVRFLCPTMAGESLAMGWLEESGSASRVDLLGYRQRHEMADLYRQSAVVVSPSTHDGTPNTLLEAMACGCYPVVGDIESLREWIIPGVNGMLVDPADPQALADAIVSALDQPELRQRAREVNLRLIFERAEYGKTMSRAEQFYFGLIKH